MDRVSVGDTVVVVHGGASVDEAGPTGRRLVHRGIIPGAAVTVIRRTTGGVLPGVPRLPARLLGRVATMAADKREIGLRWTMVGMGIQWSLAWLLAVATFQITRLFW